MKYQNACTNIKQIIVKTVLFQQDNRDYYYNIINNEGVIKKWHSDNSYFSYILNPCLVVFKELNNTIMDGKCIRIQAVYKDDVFYNYLSISFSRDLFIIS